MGFVVGDCIFYMLAPVFYLYLLSIFDMIRNATLKVVLDPKDWADKKLLKLRVTFNRVSHYYSLNTSRRLGVEELSNTKLKAYKEAMDEVRPAYNIALGIVTNLGKDFSFALFKTQYKNELFGERIDYTSFSSFADGYIRNLRKESTRRLYKTSANWVERVQKGAKLESIDELFVDSMVDKMKEEGVSENSIRLYCRQLKAIFQSAIKHGKVKGENPFSKYAKASGERSIISLSAEEFVKIRDYKPTTPQTKFGKDFFFLSFTCSGLNLGDILRLKNENIDDDAIKLQRHKTGEQIVILLNPYARALFQEYGRIDSSCPNNYVLPYLSHCKDEVAIHNKIHDIIHDVNKGLETICNEIGLRKVTTYDARHAYATLGRDLTNLKDLQLQKVLGHVDFKTTQAYLDRLSSKTLKDNDNAISKMMGDDNRASQSVEPELLEALFARFGKEEVLKVLNASKTE